jgi:quercetin dioxygenase-like cupin family protein
VFDGASLEALAEHLREPAPPALRDLLRGAPLGGRLHRFAEPLAQLMDVDLARARALLDHIDAPGAFEAGPFPGLDITLCHVEGGPAVANAITGFVRVAPGLSFPEHEHLGEEHVLVLQGRLVERGTGLESGPGDIVTRAAGTSHELSALPGGTDLLYLAVVQTGVKIGDAVMGPGSPEL